jgi:hypothetical protein
MKVIKKYTAVQIYAIEDKNSEQMFAKLKYGNIEGPYYSKTYPEEEFDTEDEALEYAYKYNKHANWLILPIVIFED